MTWQTQDIFYGEIPPVDGGLPGRFPVVPSPGTPGTATHYSSPLETVAFLKPGPQIPNSGGILRALI